MPLPAFERQLENLRMSAAVNPGQAGRRSPHATTLLLAGVPVHVVAARLGHADPSITLRVYAHVISDQLAEAADIFARAIAATG
jgi:integrase